MDYLQILSNYFLQKLAVYVNYPRSRFQYEHE